MSFITNLLATVAAIDTKALTFTDVEKIYQSIGSSFYIFSMFSIIVVMIVGILMSFRHWKAASVLAGINAFAFFCFWVTAIAVEKLTTNFRETGQFDFSVIANFVDGVLQKTTVIAYVISIATLVYYSYGYYKARKADHKVHMNEYIHKLYFAGLGVFIVVSAVTLISIYVGMMESIFY